MTLRDVTLGGKERRGGEVLSGRNRKEDVKGGFKGRKGRRVKLNEVTLGE